MAVGKIKKTVDEIKRVTVDYSRWLGTSETVVSVIFSITPVTSPALAIASNAIAGDGKSVSMFVDNGVDDNTYDILVQITTSDGQIKEDEVKVVVNNL
jgi:hypothetical protein